MLSYPPLVPRVGNREGGGMPVIYIYSNLTVRKGQVLSLKTNLRAKLAEALYAIYNALALRRLPFSIALACFNKLVNKNGT